MKYWSSWYGGLVQSQFCLRTCSFFLYDMTYENPWTTHEQ